MGIAQRTIHVKKPLDTKKQKRLNVLAYKAKTLGDWIVVKRLERNLTAGHFAMLTRRPAPLNDSDALFSLASSFATNRS